MPAEDINLGDLASRLNREKVTPGGIKRIALNQYRRASEEGGGGIGGIVKFFVDIAGRFVGFAIKAVFGAISWGISTIWQFICSTTQFLWTFDWNQSDAAMDASLQTAWDSFGGILGGALGGTLGWLLTGAVGGSILFMFNEALAVYALNEFGEEALEEISQKAASVLNAGSKIAARVIFNWAYKWARNKIMGNPDDIYLTDDQLNMALSNGTMTHAAAKKNEAGREALKAERTRKPWSFALKFEEYKETFPEGFWQNYIEEFFEEFFEAVQEGGYLLCQSMDSYYAQNTMAQNAAIKTQQRRHVVQVLLNRDPDPIVVPPPSP